MKSKKVLLIFVFAVILLLVIPCSKTMASPSNKKQQADQNIANFKKEIQKLDGQSFEILAKISQVEANILSNKAKIEELEAELVQKQEELNLATQKYDKQKKLPNYSVARQAAMEITKGHILLNGSARSESELPFILSFSDLNEEIINKSDSEFLEPFKNNLIVLNKKKLELVN